jgi:hypothetical protein
VEVDGHGEVEAGGERTAVAGRRLVGGAGAAWMRIIFNYLLLHYPLSTLYLLLTVLCIHITAFILTKTV